MTRPFVPQTVVDLAHARRDARVRREWAEADGYRAQIKAAGWVVVDRGVDFDLRPARPADVVEDGEVRYGSSDSVPSLLDEPDAVAVTVVMTAVAVDADGPSGPAGPGPGSSRVVVVTGAEPATGPGDGIDGLPGEVVRLAAPGSIGTLRNAGIRRASGTIVVLADGPATPAPELVRDLVAALADPTVAVAGTVGLVSTGLPRFEASPARDVDAVTGIIAFRRSDFRRVGPFDERFQVTA